MAQADFVERKSAVPLACLRGAGGEHAAELIDLGELVLPGNQRALGAQVQIVLGRIGADAQIGHAQVARIGLPAQIGIGRELGAGFPALGFGFDMQVGHSPGVVF